MVTYFNKTDLVDFGNYLLSKERKEIFKEHPDPLSTLDERLSKVHHSDVENFLNSKRNK